MINCTSRVTSMPLLSILVIAALLVLNVSLVWADEAQSCEPGCGENDCWISFSAPTFKVEDGQIVFDGRSRCFACSQGVHLEIPCEETSTASAIMKEMCEGYPVIGGCPANENEEE